MILRQITVITARIEIKWPRTQSLSVTQLILFPTSQWKGFFRKKKSLIPISACSRLRSWGEKNYQKFWVSIALLFKLSVEKKRKIPPTMTGKITTRWWCSSGVDVAAWCIICVTDFGSGNKGRNSSDNLCDTISDADANLCSGYFRSPNNYSVNSFSCFSALKATNTKRCAVHNLLFGWPLSFVPSSFQWKWNYDLLLCWTHR